MIRSRSAERFITTITQHIPEKSFQMVRYYEWYLNKSQGILNKQVVEGSSDELIAPDIKIVDVSDYQTPRIPSKIWRQLVKKLYEGEARCTVIAVEER